MIDRDGHSLLFVEIKARTGRRDQAIPPLLDRIHRFGFPFGMFIDPEVILIYQDGDPEPVACLSTPEALRSYDPDHANNRRWTFHDYLQGLIESWLVDYATSWRHREPPHHSKMVELGLDDRLVGAKVEVGGEASR